MTKCSRHLSHWFPASARELLSHDALFPLFSARLQNAIDSQSLILSRNMHPSVRNWCFLKQDEAPAHHFQLTDGLWSAAYLQTRRQYIFLFPTALWINTFVVGFFRFVFYCFCNILLYAPKQRCIRFTLTHLADRLLLHNHMRCGAKCFWSGEKRWGFSKALP